MIVVKTDIGNAIKEFDLISARNRMCAARALTAVAKIAQGAVRQRMLSEFDRPIPFTLNSLRVVPATPANLWASVFFKDRKGRPLDSESHYLWPETFGGRRARKGYEGMLLRAGVLRSNEFTVPADGFPLDHSGNIPVGVIKQILSQLKAAERFAGSKQNKTNSKRSKRAVAKAGTFFVSRGHSTGAGLPRGIYQRVKTGFGWATRAVMMIVVGKPRYKPRIPFYTIGKWAMDTQFRANYELELARPKPTAPARR